MTKCACGSGHLRHYCVSCADELMKRAKIVTVQEIAEVCEPFLVEDRGSVYVVFCVSEESEKPEIESTLWTLLKERENEVMVESKKMKS